MPTWADMRIYARSRYTLDDDQENLISVILGFKNGRSHKVVMRPQSAFDQEWIEFRTAVCPESAMPALDALKRNATIEMGALALDDGLYVLTYRMPSQQMDVEEFELPIRALATIADGIELRATNADEY